MSNFQMIGRVLPEYLQVTVLGHPEFNIKSSQFEIDIKVGIHNGIVLATCDLKPDLNAENFGNLMSQVYGRIVEACHVVVDLMSLSYGIPLTVTLETVIDKGVPRPIQIRNNHVQGLIKSFRMDGRDLPSLVPIVTSSNSIIYAIRDLADTLHGTHEQRVKLARAIETFRNVVAGPDTDRKDRWEKFNESLNLSPSYTIEILKGAQGPRHGDHDLSSRENLLKFSAKAWTIFDRFIEYRKRGNQPLPLSEFPLLD